MSRTIVLGGTAGIGAATVARLQTAGHDVVPLGRRAGEGQPGVRADIRDFVALAAVLASLEQEEHIDALISCVGVGFYAPLGTDNTTAWSQILDTNLRGLLNLASAVQRDLPDLGHLIHVSSLAAHGISQVPGNLAYSVAKAGARTIVQDLRRELRAQGRRTRVSMVSPGFVADTDFGRNFFMHTPQPAHLGGIYDADINLTADDVAAAVEYVLGLPEHVEVLDLLLSPTEQVG